MKYLTATAAVLGLSLAAAMPAHAQNVNANNLVSVQISDSLLENIANDLSVDVSDIDLEVIDDNTVAVQAPIGVAANVCGLDANVLAEDAKDGAVTCDAQSTSQAFNKIIQRNVSQG